MEATKAKEKEMVEEKEAERVVSCLPPWGKEIASIRRNTERGGGGGEKHIVGEIRMRMEMEMGW